jgi:mRNA interferase RelE/StbE
VTYRIELTSSARRALTKELPESAAVACWEFIRGPLAENPQRVGKALRDQLAGRYSARRGEFRVIYQIIEDRVVVRVINIRHRRDAYRG